MRFGSDWAEQWKSDVPVSVPKWKPDFRENSSSGPDSGSGCPPEMSPAATRWYTRTTTCSSTSGLLKRSYTGSYSIIPLIQAPDGTICLQRKLQFGKIYPHFEQIFRHYELGIWIYFEIFNLRKNTWMIPYMHYLKEIYKAKFPFMFFENLTFMKQ